MQIPTESPEYQGKFDKAEKNNYKCTISSACTYANFLIFLYKTVKKF